ncbi:ABC-type glycerol-3-phosphate transport system, substrate-binding protein [Ruminococcaceae bacterium FB2012]|nr:ABC-type glycerol-3-phosphate transport system, substrate-binding protein [Ruminococcaceae bacterium FB2012]
MKNTFLKRVISSALALSLAASCGLTAFAAESGNQVTDLSAEVIDASNRENAYSNYVKKHADAARPQKEVIINGADFVKFGDGAVITKETVDGEPNVMKWANQVGTVDFKVNVPETGWYNIEAKYEALNNEAGGNTTSVEFALLIDGVCPYTTASRITLPKRWVNKTEIQQDVRGNDIRPGQIAVECWQVSPFKDTDGLRNEALGFYIEAGEHTFTLQSQKAQFALAYMKLFNETKPAPYVAPDANEIQNSHAERILLEGENATYKSDRTLFPTADRNSYLTSSANGQSPTKTRYNTIGKDNWNKATQAATWEVDITTAGCYKIGIRAKQDSMRGMYSNRRLYIDGVVPCAECEQLKFYYDTSWQLTVPSIGEEPMFFYLDAGKHTITLEAVPGEIGEIMGDIDEIVYQVNSYYRQIRAITGPNPDEYNNYDIKGSIPGILDRFKEYSESLRAQMKKIEKLSGTGGTEAVTLDKLAIVLDKCVSKADRIPNMMSQIKDNVTSVSSWVNQYREQPLEVDMIEVLTDDQEFTECDEGFFKSLGYGFKAFIGSFFEDYNSLAEDDEEAMICWTSLGRDNATVIQTLINNDYNPTAKTKVNLKLVQGGIIEATFAGKGPDLALFMGGDFPIQLAARDVLVNLKKFDDYDEVMKRFAPQAGVLYEYNGGCYGLPVSQTFPMLFYRSDVLSQYGIDPKTDLNTWENLLKVLPTLQRNYMEVGLILPVGSVISPVTEAGNTFASMLLQKGVNYYSDNLDKTNFDTQEAIDSFDAWTKFYTTYSFEQTYDAFTRFRQGDMPVLIQNYTFFNQLTVAAPEIKGCWSFQPIPGTKQEDGSINHASCSVGSAALIFSKLDEDKQKDAWEFIKWFTSDETMTSYGNDIESIVGTMGRFDTANLNALEQLSWTTNEVSLLKNQMLSQVEIPVIPASYGVTRGLINAFREVVNNAENARDTLFWYNKDINDEITRKREDLGLNS